jgi:hypothetical protein
MKKLNQLFEPNFNYSTTFLYQSKSNNQTHQIIEFFKFKSLNVFKFKIEIDTDSAFSVLNLKSLKLNSLNILVYKINR